MRDKIEITYDRTFQGAWRITAMVNGEYKTRQYFDYTKREAAAEFRAEFSGRVPRLRRGPNLGP
jgi:hypothetical protein